MAVENLLYRQPELYELVYPEPNEETPDMCRRMFARFLPSPPRSILDIGCGTGRDLAALTSAGSEGVGVDALPVMVAYARQVRPQCRWQVGEMQSVRLGRTFDAILCMGSAFMYALTNQAVAETLATFAAHARPGTLLVLDINNAASYLGGGGFREQQEFAVDTPQFKARGIATHTFDRRRQLLVRRRTWMIPGQPPVEDYCEYRLFFPSELEQLLAGVEFRVAGMFDNKALSDSDLTGARLYVAAVCERG
jgi:SAM-dependent methyltransferase